MIKPWHIIPAYLIVAFLTYGYLYNQCEVTVAPIEISYCQSEGIVKSAYWPIHWLGVISIAIFK